MSGDNAASLRDIEDLHREACEEGKGMFRDPHTNLYVMTAHYHLKRGDCCGRQCKFCPYGHRNVGANHRCVEPVCSYQLSDSAWTPPEHQ